MATKRKNSDEAVKVLKLLEQVNVKSLQREADENDKAVLVKAFNKAREIGDFLKEKLDRSDTVTVNADPYHVARMYYEKKMSQDEIAARLGVSRPTVKEMLIRAEEAGVYRPLVVPQREYGYLRRIEAALEDKFGLRDAVVVSGRHETLRAKAEEHELYREHRREFEDMLVAREAIVNSLAQAAAQYLDTHLRDKDVLCIPWGFLAHTIASFLRPNRRLPDLTVVPMLGVLLAKPGPGWFEANFIVQEIAQAYHAHYFCLPAPAIVRDLRQRDMIQQLPLVQEVLKEIDKATFVISGLTYADSKDSRLVKGGLLDSKKVEELKKERGAKGELCAWWFDAEGNPVRDEEIIPIGLGGQTCGIEKLREMARQDDKTVLVVVGANRSRSEALYSALRGKLLNVLVTDDITAQLLLADLKE